MGMKYLDKIVSGALIVTDDVLNEHSHNPISNRLVSQSLQKVDSPFVTKADYDTVICDATNSKYYNYQITFDIPFDHVPKVFVTAHYVNFGGKAGTENVMTVVGVVKNSVTKDGFTLCIVTYSTANKQIVYNQGITWIAV